MDYKKAYKEALEKAEGIIRYYKEHNRSDEASIEDLEVIFPELAESEDERIRKTLVEMVHDTTGDSLWVDYNVHKEDALAWLDKQGERNNIVEQLTAFAQHLNKRGAFRDDLCMDFEHEAQSFIESQNHEKYENHETIKITKI